MPYIDVSGNETAVGVARYAMDPDGRDCEFAIVVSDAYRRRGIATKLLQDLMRYAEKTGIKTIHGEVFTSNQAMLGLMRHLGFDSARVEDDVSLDRVSRNLTSE